MQRQDKTLTAPDTRQINVVKCEFIFAGTAKQFIFKMAELPSLKKTLNNPRDIFTQLDIKHCLSESLLSLWHVKVKSLFLWLSHSPSQSVFPLSPLSPVSILRSLGINLSWSALVFVWARRAPEPDTHGAVMFRAAWAEGREGRDLARDYYQENYGSAIK